MNKFFVFSLVVFAMACAPEPGVLKEVTPPEVGVVLGESVGDSFLEGTLQDFVGIEGFATRFEMQNNSSLFEAKSYVPHEEGEAMSIVRVRHGNFYNPEFDVGNTMLFDSAVGNPNSDLKVTVFGCLFYPNHDRPYYDDEADEVEVFTEMIGEEIKRINYISRWLDEDNNVIDEMNGFINIKAEEQ